ncbi:TPA: restriction endonuclease subunit S [Staphylococcus aureus]|uniref:restriction endonuclease subunit S n=2 Tax=Staphylococcus TaxID=1279 RepID=UPI000A10BF4F|nr:restriction endonuclease subunit S [Staphylococcus lugdunensis]NFY95537.1 restriction endonuclease subunit S [Staphylococcus aureus]
MKDSGIEWIGEIPENWEVKKVKYMFRIVNGNGFPENLQGEKEGDYPFYKNSDINKLGIYINKSNNYISKNTATINKFTVIPSKSILIGKIGEALKRNHRKINLSECMIDNNMMALVPKENELFSYYLLTTIDMFWFDNNGTIPSLNSNKLRNFKIPYVNKTLQKNIVEILNKKTQKIDKLISSTQQSIKELKKYKQSLITEAVTKGLDPNVEMKDSGIEWVGKIPKHWSVRKISNYFSQVKDKNDELEEENLLSLSYGSIIRRNINSTDGLLPANFKNYNIVESGDIVLRMTDLQNDKVSLRTGFVTEKGIITSAYITIRTDHKNVIFPKYIRLFLHSFDIYKGFYGMGSGVRQNVTYNDIKKIEVIVPSINEQQRIVSYLDEKSASIDKLIEDKTKVIEELEDYKKSLIYEYVTGKKEV